ncbi:MAG: hypothetical protein M1817_002819 [Caeruleum heppii]|nr:MAG: hypothetical protein M1817_002819 [Caeruleum heppii]
MAQSESQQIEKSQVIIITGASRGIGYAITQTLLTQHPDTRLLLISRNTSPLQSLYEEYPARVDLLSADISDYNTAATAIRVVTKKWGRLDGVVINHGVMDPVGKVADVGGRGWEEAFKTNVFGGVELIKDALPLLRANHGRIILTSSGAAINAYTSWGSYGASKAALNHLALTLRVEEPLVTTVSIRPGVVDTQMQMDIRGVHIEKMDAKDQEKFMGLKEKGELLRPEQPGGVIARLVMGATKELSGNFLSWNDEALAAFQSS